MISLASIHHEFRRTRICSSHRGWSSIAAYVPGSLARAGCNVEIYERASGPLTSRGPGSRAKSNSGTYCIATRRLTCPPPRPDNRHYLLPDGDEGVRAEMPLQLTSWYAIPDAAVGFFRGSYHPVLDPLGFDQAAGRVLRALRSTLKSRPTY